MPSDDKVSHALLYWYDFFLVAGWKTWLESVQGKLSEADADGKRAVALHKLVSKQPIQT